MAQRTRMLCYCAFLTALQVVLSRFASVQVGTWLKIGFGFLPIALAGRLYGPWLACTVAAVSDVIGALLFPSGPFFPGFTVVAGISGILYGMLLHRGRRVSWVRALIAAFAVAVICNITLNTVCLCVTGLSVKPGNEGFRTVLWTRIWKNLLLAPVNAAITVLVLKVLERLPGWKKRT